MSDGALRISITGDDSQFQKTLADIPKKLKDFREKIKGATGQNIPVQIEITAQPITPILENSIAGIRKQIDELNAKKIRIDVTNEGEIAKINQEIGDLTNRLIKADTLSFDKNGKISANAGKARQAITSLSLVAQDLPFGFIAIQNNIPAVLQTFTELQAKNNGLKATFKELAGALVGPAGFFLAFSAITGAVTYAVKEYGSLSNAINALFGTYVKFNEVVNRADESFKKFNESVLTTAEIAGQGEAAQAGQILKIRALSSVVLDLTKTENERKKALDGLQKLDKERFKNFDIEKGKIDGLREAVVEYTRALIAQGVANKFADQASETSVELEKQRNSLGTLITELDKIQNKYKNVASEAEKYKKAVIEAQGRRGAGIVTAAPGVIEFIQLTEKITQTEGGIVSLRERLEQLNTSTFNATQSASALSSSIENTGNKASGAGKKVKEYKEELQGAIPLFDLFSPSKEQFNFDILKDFFGPNFIKQLKESQKNLNSAQKQLDNFREKQFESPGLPSVTPRVIKSPFSLEMDISREDMIKEFEKTKIILDEVFFAPLSDLFQNFFDTGKFAFQEFGKSILNVIKSIVSKIIATGIINLLANILLPGSGVAANFAGRAATGAGGGILGAFGAAFKSVLGIGKIANPNFGGVQGGGMQLAGEVVFRQRGSDLIGVINRTNGTINRVG